MMALKMSRMSKKILFLMELRSLVLSYSREGSKGVNQDAAIVHLGYGVEHGAFCGVFDGHGKNGHIVSRTVRNRLPSLLLNQKNALEEIDSVRDHGSEKADGGLVPLPGESFHKWKDACVGAFKVMDKEIKLQESLDCSCSGTTAVVVGEDLVIANLGDSRAVLGRTNDQKGIMPVQLTTDLKPGVPKVLTSVSTFKLVGLSRENRSTTC
ncbi:hypothetical protein DKX38_010477 [Salix brachista]|uniref:PPM-type phosphatase domain-containing protein n=1 Tax=Salix brachista TaxID=2182728 RepID=A0A5N5MGB7_9ROSI|nr:hypothetical protein DKX38_010477 [Salix brachista]